LPIYEAIERADKTLIAHLAEPNGAWLPLDARNPELTYYSNNPQWHMFGRARAPAKGPILAARDRVLARYPKLRVVGCHLGSDEDDLKQLARRLDAYPNFAVDTAARVRYLARGNREQVREFLIRYQDRILYATDFSLGEGDPGRAARSMQSTHDRDWTFFGGDAPLEYGGHSTRGLALDDGILRKIFRENALRWLPGLRA
jgi:predicted TIM-barrel fold metal-dependent hydrolase